MTPESAREAASGSVPERGWEPAPESAPATRPAGPSRGERLGLLSLVVLLVLCGITLALGFMNKDRCTGPHFDDAGRSQPSLSVRNQQDVCYSDIQFLWLGRDIDKHVFPYVHGGMTDEGTLEGGVVEYPVLTGLVMWVSALHADNDADFLLLSALLLAPFGLATAWMLGRLAGWRALLWAVGPPLVLYAFHNWELPVVLCAVAAVFVLHRGWGERGAARPLRGRATLAAVLLGLGFAFKVYPAIFVPPLMLYVLTGGSGGTELAPRHGTPARRLDWLGAVRVAGAALGTALLVNLPFMVAGFEGWKASFEFQFQRTADITSNSIWFWGLRPHSDSEHVQDVIGVLSPVLMLAAFGLACLLGWLRYRKVGTYPWVEVSAAMLCAFLLLHKVHSPQYTLWLLPMLVLVRVRWGWIVAYLAADLAMGIGIFRWYFAIWYADSGGIADGLAAQLVVIGVWGRAALLVGLFFAFLAARSTVDNRWPPAAPPVGAAGFR